MIIAILTNTPIWVWVLLTALAVLGLMQTRARTISCTRAYTLPWIFIALSLTGVVRTAGSFPVALAAWALGAAAAWLLLRRVAAVRGASWLPATASFQVPGSWLPLTLILGLFMLRYAVAVAQAMHPELASSVSFYGPTNFVFGVFAGLFWARSWSLRALVRATDPGRSPAAGGDLRQTL
jgi:hypothetical protein